MHTSLRNVVLPFVSVVIAALVWWVAIGDCLHGLLAGMALAMAILPEDLPMVLTLFLGLGAWRLACEKVLAS